MFARSIMVVLLALALGGCGTTRVVRQANDVAEAGKTYATAMEALAGYVLDKEVEDQYHMLARYRDYQGTDKAYYEGRLKRSTDDTVALSKQVGIFRAHAKKLGDYFDALNALVDANVKETAAAATRKAAEGLNAFGKALSDTGIHVSTEGLAAISKLGEIAFTELHGAEVKRVFQRDAKFIAEHIALQDAALEHFKREIDRMDDKERFDRYEKELKPTYVKDTEKPLKDRAALPGEFKTKWIAFVKEPAVATQLKTASDAAKKMQEAWVAILEGREDMSDVLAESGKLLSVAEQARALHQNRHKSAAP